MISPRGNATVLSYDEGTTTRTRQLRGITYATGSRMTFSYDADDRLESVVDPRGFLTTLAWDAGNKFNRTGIIDASGGHYTFTFNSAGQLTAQTTPLSLRITQVYDAGGQLVDQTSPFNQTSSFFCKI